MNIKMDIQVVRVQHLSLHHSHAALDVLCAAL